MRSPGASRIIHTRTRSLSETRVVPTHGLGALASRSNSAAISGGQALLSERTAALSIIVRDMAFLQRTLAHYIANFCRLRTAAYGTLAYREFAPRHRDRWLHERAPGRPAAPARRVGRGRVRAGRKRAFRPRRRHRRAARADRDAAAARPRFDRSRRRH